MGGVRAPPIFSAKLFFAALCMERRYGFKALRKDIWSIKERISEYPISIMISIKDLTYGVDDEQGKKDILRNISLEIPDDCFAVITGPNGGGKSTLAKVLAGVLKPASGTITFDGIDITDMSITDRAKADISYAFQQPVKFKGIEVIDLLRLAAGDKTLSVGDACTYLSEVGLCARDYINREVDSSLSGGELKRIEIATVLARASKLAIFDEPEAGIDLWSFNNLISVFRRIKEKTHGSIIIISHQERILEIADTVIVIENGQIKKQGAREDVLPSLLGTDSAVGECSVKTQVRESAAV